MALGAVVSGARLFHLTATGSAAARAEVTDRMPIIEPRHLHSVLDEYAAHDNSHRARDLRRPHSGDMTMAEVADLAAARIRRQRILSGLIKEHERAA